MKKVMVSLSVTVFAFVANVSSQIAAPTPEPTAYTYTLEDCIISGITMKEGSNTIPVPKGRGTIQLIKRGDRFSDVVFTDAAGKATRLAPNNGSTNNLPKPNCPYKIPDACFGAPTLNAVMCLCRPTNVASTSDPYTISLLLPAVQSTREAARRSN